LQGLPANYSPGANYTFTVALAREGQSRWGFEMTAIKADLTRGGQLAVINTTEMQLTVSSTYNRDYLKHWSAGTYPGTPSGHNWQISWTAPPAGMGTVTFYLAGNAADNSGTNQGDFIYTTTATLPEGLVGVVEPVYQQPETPQLLTAWPNPFNPQVILNLSAQPWETVHLDLLDVAGRLVDAFILNSDARGEIRLPLDLGYLPSGRYFARASTHQGQQVITLIKAK
jgi:hypothetical protein